MVIHKFWIISLELVRQGFFSKLHVSSSFIKFKFGAIKVITAFVTGQDPKGTIQAAQHRM